VYVQVFWLR